MIYEYECQTCNYAFEIALPMADMYLPEQSPCAKCDNCTVKKVIRTAPSIGDPVRLGIRRPDNGFKEVLQRIHKGNRGSQLNKSRWTP